LLRGNALLPLNELERRCEVPYNQIIVNPSVNLDGDLKTGDEWSGWLCSSQAEVIQNGAALLYYSTTTGTEERSFDKAFPLMEL